MKRCRYFFFLVVFFISSPSFGSFISQSASEFIERSDSILVVSINSAKSHGFAGDNIYWNCGFSYEASVQDVLKGNKSQKSIEFASANPMKIGTEYLVAIRNTTEDFESDVVVSKSPLEKQQYRDCLNELPLMKEDWLFTSEFAQKQGWIYGGYKVWVPKSVEGFVYEVTEVKINDEVGIPSKLRYGSALPFSVTLPVLMLKWESYRQYLLDEIETLKANQPAQPMN